MFKWSTGVKWSTGIRNGGQGFPGGSMVKNPPASVGTWVQSLVWEDPTCCRATKPMHHSYWACAREPRNHNYWSPNALEPVLRNKGSHCSEKSMHHNEEWSCSPQLEKVPAQQRRPSTAKKINILKKIYTGEGEGGTNWESSTETYTLLLLLLLSCFSRVWLCATPEMAAHQAPPSLGFSRQEHWSGLPFPSPMHESEKGKWSRSVVSDS